MSSPIEMNEFPPVQGPGKKPINVREIYAAFHIPPLSKCIRVLDIAASSTDILDAPIIAQLRVVDLEDALKPRFTALSYV